jgi:micrococcal nuclease
MHLAIAQVKLASNPKKPMSRLLGLALLVTATAAAARCQRGTMTGEVTFVRDGDTIEVRGLPIRLNGLAAPEWDEPGGDAAMDAMIELVEGRTLRCELNGERTHDRCVGVCYLDGADIAAEMVASGVARDCPRFSGGRYEQIEAQAAAVGATIGRTYRLPGYCRER